MSDRSLVIRQKKFSTQHTFTLSESSFNFAYKEKLGSGDMDVMYADLPVKTSVRIDANHWLRNVGYIWVAVGSAMLTLGIIRGDYRGQAFWLLVGLVCLAFYKLSKVSYTVFSVSGGAILVIQDGKKHDQIVSELRQRRRQQLLALYGEVNFDNEPEREVAKFEWLAQNDVLSQAEADEKIRQVRAAIASDASETRLLN